MSGILAPIAVDTMFPVSESDLAYLAGIIDGEGTILWNGTIVLRATNTYEPLIDWLVLRCGGSKHREVVSEERRDTTRWRPKWRWTVVSIRAAVILEDVLPYMLVKRERGEELLERWRSTEEERNQTVVRKHVLAMMQDGWPIPARLRPRVSLRS